MYLLTFRVHVMLP